jgi:hypothetical protein
MTSRIVARSLSIADSPRIEFGTADSFLRFAVAITVILPRRGCVAVRDRRVTPFPQLLSLSMFIQPLPRFSFLPMQGGCLRRVGGRIRNLSHAERPEEQVGDASRTLSRYMGQRQPRVEMRRFGCSADSGEVSSHNCEEPRSAQKRGFQSFCPNRVRNLPQMLTPKFYIFLTLRGHRLLASLFILRAR